MGISQACGGPLQTFRQFLHDELGHSRALLDDLVDIVPYQGQFAIRPCDHAAGPDLIQDDTDFTDYAHRSVKLGDDDTAFFHFEGATLENEQTRVLFPSEIRMSPGSNVSFPVISFAYEITVIQSQPDLLAKSTSKFEIGN